MPLKLVVLDGYALNPGDLSWDGLRQLADLTVYDRTHPADVIARAIEADLILTNKTLLSAEIIRALPRLRYIGVMATGYNIVDLAVANLCDITVTNIPAYGTSSVAQLTFALLLELCHNVGTHSAAVRTGAWTQNPDWSFWLNPLIELTGKTMGIVGFGRIGRQVAKIAEAMGMRVIVVQRGSGDFSSTHQVEVVSRGELFSQSDVVSLHCPLNAETQGFVASEQLALMKPTAFLVNTSRGQLIVEQDLANALNKEQLAGAALDVLSSEPPRSDNPLLAAKNCIITPHIAWATREARARLMGLIVKNLAAFLKGEKLNVIGR